MSTDTTNQPIIENLQALRTWIVAQTQKPLVSLKQHDQAAWVKRMDKDTVIRYAEEEIRDLRNDLDCMVKNHADSPEGDESIKVDIDTRKTRITQAEKALQDFRNDVGTCGTKYCAAGYIDSQMGDVFLDDSTVDSKGHVLSAEQAALHHLGLSTDTVSPPEHGPVSIFGGSISASTLLDCLDYLIEGGQPGHDYDPYEEEPDDDGDEEY